MVVGLSVAVLLTMGPSALASGPQPLAEEAVAERAKGAWESGALNTALEILDEGIQENPQALTLHKLRGDVFATSRRPREALAAYESALASKPTVLEVRWAKWSVLVRSGAGDEAIAELQRIAQMDAQNPLIHVRLAQALRKVDRLEESRESYKKAVQLVPDQLSWRLGLARAHFDVLDYPGAYEEVQYVLERIEPGSPLELPAKNLLSVIQGSGKDRGRRFQRVFTPDATDEQLKEWALMRADAWRLFAAGRYAEAEPAYRRLLVLNPKDPTAAHQLGVTLMELGRCEEALPVFRQMSAMDSSDEEYADTVFRTGQCLVELERWSEAWVQFQILHEAAVEFDESYKDVPLPPGTRRLDTKKIAAWLEQVRPHVPEADRVAPRAPAGSSRGSEAELYAMYEEIANRPLKPQKPLDERASLMGRDADFSWFRFIIPAGHVMRDDFPTGEHDFIPLDPEDSFPTTQRAIYLVFALVTASYDAVPLTAQCMLEASEITRTPVGAVQDRVVMSMSDQSGYFMLSRPANGWTPGLYRCGLFVGERTSADTQADEVRFRIIEPAPVVGTAAGGAQAVQAHQVGMPVGAEQGGELKR